MGNRPSLHSCPRQWMPAKAPAPSPLRESITRYTSYKVCVFVNHFRKDKNSQLCSKRPIIQTALPHTVGRVDLSTGVWDHVPVLSFRDRPLGGHPHRLRDRPPTPPVRGVGYRVCGEGCHGSVDEIDSAPLMHTQIVTAVLSSDWLGLCSSSYLFLKHIGCGDAL